MNWRDPDHLPAPLEFDTRAEETAERNADMALDEVTIDQAALDAFDSMQIQVTFTRAQASHLLALAMQFSITERRATVSRQLNHDAMRKLDGALS